MDLVDIDQVLDNLELREAADENRKLVGATQQASTTSNGIVGAGDIASDSNLVGGVSNSGGGGGGVIDNVSSTASGSSNKGGFVGVSQVFNSLDDYCKNVESLETQLPQRYDEECRPIANNQPTTMTAMKITTTTTTTSTKINDSSPVQEVVSLVSSFRPESITDDEEEEACNDIHKFTEASKTRTLNGQGEGEDLTTTSTSDSLTTSSSSTFSSGPSPGLASSTDEHSSPLSPVDDDESVEQQGALLPTQSTGKTITANVNAKEEEREEGVVPSGDNMGAGLSSISITTFNSNSHSVLPCEATTTVSSVLQNVLHDLSETTSSSLLSQKRDDVDTDAKRKLADSLSYATVSTSYADEDEVPQRVEHANNEGQVLNPKAAELAHKAIQEGKAQNPAQDVQAPQKQQQQQHQAVRTTQHQQPITFGSTMDEISDTELDSMLQEMDIDDVAECDYVEKKQQPVEEESSAIAVEDDVDADVAVSSNADNCNADNFSQASTVEFSEIKAAAEREALRLTAAEVEAVATRDDSPNSIASSYTSTESSLDERDFMGRDNGAAAANESNEFNDDDDDDQCTMSRPQRPTTLDLPTRQLQLHANAGQTPPANDEGGAKQEAGDDVVNNQTNEIDASTNAGGGQMNDDVSEVPEVQEASGYSDPHANLGKVPPIWVPDYMAAGCMQCQTKFTMIKRRHHCRACGKVLCSVCCSQKFKLAFLPHPESRVCVQCYLILNQKQMADGVASVAAPDGAATDDSGELYTAAVAPNTPSRSPNPNNPMEYCSTIPPHRQVSGAATQPPPSVIVPVGVLKKEGGSHSSNSSNSSGTKARKRKSVMFMDGIAPGSELAYALETGDWKTSGDPSSTRRMKQQVSDKQNRNNAANNKPPTPARVDSSGSDALTMGMVAQLFRGSIPPGAAAAAVSVAQSGAKSSNNTTTTSKHSSDASAAVAPTSGAKQKGESAGTRSKRLPPSGCDEQGCFIPKGEISLPPIYVTKGENCCDFDYKEVSNSFELIERLQRETLKFALTRNFYVLVKIANLKCCMNRIVINFTTAGMHHVGNDEIIILLEYQPPASRDQMTEPPLPKDIFLHLYEIYWEAEQGRPIAELSYTSPRQINFLGSREYGGFIYIRATFQCLQDVIVPEQPFLIGILIHRYEVPWAKIFPLRLMLRLGAQYRYYPCPHISMRNRESVYAEIAQTIINFLADFRNYSYTLPWIKGMYIHMEDRQTTVLIPRNHQEDVIKAMNNASDHILAFGGNFSKAADGHLVCMQNVNGERSEMYAYSTQAININGQPRKVTGASFFVLNEALKSSSGLSGKCSIVEDGLMVQIMPAKMEQVRNALRNQKDIDIVCGPVDADEQQTEIVSIKWVDNYRDFNIGVKSPIDDKSMEGVPSMRAHASFNYASSNYSIRPTDIFVLKYDNWYSSGGSSNYSDITRMAEQIAHSASMALVPFLDLLAASGSTKLGLRATLHQENVCYEAGARGCKLPPLYMNALDNHLIPTLHDESSGIENEIVLELVFYILNV